MSRSAAVLLVLAVLVVTVLSACGSDDSGGSSNASEATATSAQTRTEATPPAAATSAETTAKTTAAKATPANNTKVVQQCHAVLDSYVAMLRGIRDSVDGTPQFKTYNGAVGQMVDQYSNKFNAREIPSPSCAKFVAQPVTGAYAKYYLATQNWTICRQRQRCGAAMADLKKQWKAADAYLKSAEKGFSSVTTD